MDDDHKPQTEDEYKIDKDFFSRPVKAKGKGKPENETAVAKSKALKVE